MNKELIERLRRIAKRPTCNSPDSVTEAADEIERLNAENKELFDAMQHPSYEEERRLRAERDVFQKRCREYANGQGLASDLERLRQHMEWQAEQIESLSQHNDQLQKQLLDNLAAENQMMEINERLTAENEREKEMRNATQLELEKVEEENERLTAELTEARHRERELFGGTKRDLATKLDQQIEKSRRLKAELATVMQAITDPENQPSQFGTVTLDYLNKEIATIKTKLEVAEAPTKNVGKTLQDRYALKAQSEPVVTLGDNPTLPELYEYHGIHTQQPAQSEPVAHKWDGSGERCVICGDKDWMGTSCTQQPAYYLCGCGKTFPCDEHDIAFPVQSEPTR